MWLEVVVGKPLEVEEVVGISMKVELAASM